MNPVLNYTEREEISISGFQASASRIPQEGISSYNINLSLVKKRSPCYT